MAGGLSRIGSRLAGLHPWQRRSDVDASRWGVFLSETHCTGWESVAARCAARVVSRQGGSVGLQGHEHPVGQSALSRNEGAGVKCIGHALDSMWASMMRRTSSAIEMPRRLASLFKKVRCGSVKEIICFVMRLLDSRHEATSQCVAHLIQLNKCFIGMVRCARAAVRFCRAIESMFQRVICSIPDSHQKHTKLSRVRGGEASKPSFVGFCRTEHGESSGREVLDSGGLFWHGLIIPRGIQGVSMRVLR